MRNGCLCLFLSLMCLLTGCGGVSKFETNQSVNEEMRHGQLVCAGTDEEKAAYMITESVYDAVKSDDASRLYTLFSEESRRRDSELSDELDDFVKMIPDFNSYDGVVSASESYERSEHIKSIMILVNLVTADEKADKMNIVYYMENDANPDLEGCYLIEYADENTRKQSNFIWKEVNDVPGVYYNE